MDSFFNNIGNYLIRLTRELGEIAQRLDGTGWVAVSAVLLVCGWFFLRGNKIKAA